MIAGFWLFSSLHLVPGFKTIGGGVVNIKASSRVLLCYFTVIVQALFCSLVGSGFPRRGELQVIPEERLEFEPISVWVESIAWLQP